MHAVRERRFARFAKLARSIKTLKVLGANQRLLQERRLIRAALLPRFVRRFIQAP